MVTLAQRTVSSFKVLNRSIRLMSRSTQEQTSVCIAHPLHLIGACWLSQPGSCWLSAALQTHASLANAVTDLAREIQADSQMTARIKAKYKIKNTVSAGEGCLVMQGSILCRAHERDLLVVIKKPESTPHHSFCVLLSQALGKHSSHY